MSISIIGSKTVRQNTVVVGDENYGATIDIYPLTWNSFSVIVSKYELEINKTMAKLALFAVNAYVKASNDVQRPNIPKEKIDAFVAGNGEALTSDETEELIAFQEKQTAANQKVLSMIMDSEYAVQLPTAIMTWGRILNSAVAAATLQPNEVTAKNLENAERALISLEPEWVEELIPHVRNDLITQMKALFKKVLTVQGE